MAKLDTVIASLRMAARAHGSDLPAINADIALVGQAIDDRGHAALAHAKANSGTMIDCEYDVMGQELQFGNDSFAADLVREQLKLKNPTRVLLECTTLGTAEIAVLCQALASLEHITVNFLYVEPETYRPLPQEGVIHLRDFELTTRFKGFHPVPGMCYQMDEEAKQTTVLLLGFEGDRAQRAFEELKIAPGYATAVFGVPAFQPGWEYDSFANNLGTLSGKEMRGICFCGADNPKATLQYLVDLRASYPDEDTLFLAPLGPKPQALGAVLFAAFSDRVGLLYDFPVRRASRSNRIAKWHLFEAKW